MPEYLAPGVYYQRVDSSRRGIVGLRTDIAGFVGIATMGPLHTPVLVESYRQFESHFGGFTGNGYLAYCVRGFFENGGARCHVVRVAGDSARAASSVDASGVELLLDIDGLPAWRISASSAGAWGNRLQVQVQRRHNARTTSAAGQFDRHYATIASLAGMVRGGLLEINQAGKTWWRTLSLLDGANKRVYWSHPEADKRLDSDQTIADLDPTLPLTISAISYSITVRGDGRLLAHYPDLGLVEAHPRAATRVLAHPDYRIEPGANRMLPVPAEPIVIDELRGSRHRPLVLPGRAFPLRGGQDGHAALSVEDFTGDPWTVGGDAGAARGLLALEDVDEIAILAVPDIHIHPDPDPEYRLPETPPPDPCVSCPEPPEPTARFQPSAVFQDRPPLFNDTAIYRVQAAMLEQCARQHDRIALLDAPLPTADGDARGIAPVRDWRARFDSRYAALYFPWLDVPDNRRFDQPVRRVPASGHVAGQYAATDLAAGVHHAPANLPLRWVRDISITVARGAHEVLNPEGINAIISEAGRGIRILGARTLASDPDWRYVNVQRLFMMIRESIEEALQWVVFEPNDHNTRAKVHLALYGFLEALWRQGALMGDEPAQAFFIRCDEENNPPALRDNGELLVEFGIAPSIPFEFIVLRVGRRGNTLEIENSGLGRAA